MNEQQKREILQLIGDDGYAISFQSFGQYRTALMKAIAAMPVEAPAAPQVEAVAWSCQSPNGSVLVTQHLDTVRLARESGFTVRPLTYADVPAPGDAWIPVSERLPNTAEAVLAVVTDEHYKGSKPQTIRAYYIRKHAVEAHDDDVACEYSEADDRFYVNEGWYECNQYDEVNYAVTGAVHCWMPLPPPPALAAQKEGGHG